MAIVQTSRTLIALTTTVTTQSITLTAGATCLAVTIAEANQGLDPTSVKWNGTDLTKVASNTDTGFVDSSIWSIPNPDTSAAHNLVITFPGTPSGEACAYELTGTDTTNPIGVTGGNSLNGTNTTITATVLSQRANSLLLNCATRLANNAMSPSNGETQRYTTSLISAAARGTGSDLVLTTVTNYTTGYTYSSGNSHTVLSVVEIMVPNPVVVPTVTTQAVTAIKNTTATANGNVTATGGATNDIQGAVWDTTSHSDPGNTAPGSSAYANNGTASGSFSTGAFTQAMTGLKPGTTYFVRAVSHNSAGYSYGSEVSFTTINGSFLAFM